MKTEGYVIESTYKSPDEETYKMPDGNLITIKNNGIDIFHRLQSMPIAYKLTLLEVGETEVLEYLDLIYDTKASELKDILNGNWMWHETGEPMKFNDIDENEAVLGIGLTRNQIMGKLKRKSISCRDIIKILDDFENQTELIDY